MQKTVNRCRLISIARPPEALSLPLMSRNVGTPRWQLSIDATRSYCGAGGRSRRPLSYSVPFATTDVFLGVQLLFVPTKRLRTVARGLATKIRIKLEGDDIKNILRVSAAATAVLATMIFLPGAALATCKEGICAVSHEEGNNLIIAGRVASFGSFLTEFSVASPAAIMPSGHGVTFCFH